MMQHPQIDKEEIVTRYLSGELGPDEQESFELHLLTCAACQDELEADQRFSAALRSLEATGDLPAPAAEPPAARPPALRRRRDWRPLAWAASVLIALLPALFLSRENSRLEEELRRGAADTELAALQAEIDTLRSAVRDATRPRVGLPLLRLEPVRSEGEAPYRLTLAQEPEWVVLLIEPPEPLAERYVLSLEEPDGGVREFEVEPDAYGVLTLSLFSAEIEAGYHQLRARSPTGASFTTAVEFRRGG